MKGELQIILFQEHFEIRNMLQLKLICDMSVQIKTYLNRTVTEQPAECLYIHTAFQTAGSKCVPYTVKVDNADIMTYQQISEQVTEVTRIYREAVWSDKYQPKIRQSFFFYSLSLLLTVCCEFFSNFRQ